MDLKEEEILKDAIYTHWYYVSKWNALKNFININAYKHIMDIGAGSGIFSKFLLNSSKTIEKSTCVDIGYEKDSEQEINGKKIFFKKSVDKVEADLIIMMDVIEHVPNDVDLIRSYTDNVKPGTEVLISVPAFQFLFSGHDIFLGHYRRYNSKNLKKAVTDSGLEIVKLNYFFGTLFPVIVLLRLVNKLKLKLAGKTLSPKSDLKIASPFMNHLLIKIHSLELLYFKLNRFAGLTIFCLAKKK